MMLDRGAVLVWEWQDEVSMWQPYSPQVTGYIEQVMRENPKASSVSLGEADATLTPYILDLISMNQFRLDTGTLFPARRMRFPSSSAPGRGIVWEREGLPGQWVPFETWLSVLIQEAFERQQPGVRLGEFCNGSHVCFKTMTQVDFSSQKRIRVRARAQTPYPTADNFQPMVPQIVNGNLKCGSYSTYKIPVNPSQELKNVNKLLMNTNHGHVNSDRAIPRSSKKVMNIDHSIVNTSQTLANSNHLLVNCNQVNMNSHQLTVNSRHDPVSYYYGMADIGHILGNSNNEIINSDQILMNFNSAVVNYSNGPLQSIHGLGNSNDPLVNRNRDVKNTSDELINFEASIINPNYEPSYCNTTLPNSSPWSEETNSLLPDSNATSQPQWAPIHRDNCSSALLRSNSKRAASRPGLIWSDSKHKDVRAEQVMSESLNTRELNTSNSRTEEYRNEICRSISKPEEKRHEFLLLNSTPYENPGFTGANSRPPDSRPILVRSTSKPGYDRSDSRQAKCRPVLARSESWHDDVRSAIWNSDCRNIGSRPGFVRSESRSTDSKPCLASHHRGFSHSKSTSAGRGISQLTSLRRSRYLPSSICPQCLLVQSIKSASWPQRQLDTKGSLQDGHRTQKVKSITRASPLPLYNIEGSGIVPPALAGISSLLMSAAGLPVCLSVLASPILLPPPVKKRDLRPVPGIQGTSRKITNKKVKKPEEIIKQFLQRVINSPSELASFYFLEFPKRATVFVTYELGDIMNSAHSNNLFQDQLKDKAASIILLLTQTNVASLDCTLCRRTLTEGEVGRLYRCAHAYHVCCLAPLYKNGTLRCPNCQTLYGVKIGSQPPGKMTFYVIPHSLPGYPDCETIHIIYHIAPGVQGPGQPHPGMKFIAPDFPLHCYLPNMKKGREVLLLLIKAWESRLLFPVLPSHAPGVIDSVSISRIPLKTEFGSNVTGKGFPDSHYLDRVLCQLLDWGMSAD